MGTWPSMRYECTICPVGERMKTDTAWLFFLAHSTQACVIFCPISREISFLMRVFFAASSEITNLERFWAETLPATANSIAAARVILDVKVSVCIMIFLFPTWRLVYPKGLGKKIRELRGFSSKRCVRRG